MAHPSQLVSSCRIKLRQLFPQSGNFSFTKKRQPHQLLAGVFVCGYEHLRQGRTLPTWKTSTVLPQKGCELPAAR